MDTTMARQTFELQNNVQVVDPTDELFKYSAEEERRFVNEDQPWKTDPDYFTTVKISAVALIKMVTHARSGGIYEIMGVMYGKVRDHTFWIMDAAALPVEGTETRVNAGNAAFEYMVNFQTAKQEGGKAEMLRGWYHSHPGYGCWLSGIDVNTQQNQQSFNDPYLAVVIDPNRTVSAGKVDIGAFRTYPEGHKPASASSSQYQSIPQDKIEDFGVHANAYYPLKVEIYKTKLDEQLLDLLWNKYWVATLSSSLLLSNRPFATSQVQDLASKLDTAGSTLKESATLKLRPSTTSSGGAEAAEDGNAGPSKPRGKGKAAAAEYAGVEETETGLSKAAKDAARIAAEAQNGMTAQILKYHLFNTPLTERLDPAVAADAARGIWAPRQALPGRSA